MIIIIQLNFEEIGNIKVLINDENKLLNLNVGYKCFI